MLATGDANGLVQFWPMRPEAWADQACQIANRNLTEAEWQQFMGDEPYRETCPWLTGTGLHRRGASLR
jgi:hypothetical protein